MWDLVESLRSSGTTVLLTTHYMDEAERLADRIAVIAHGEIVATGTPDSLGKRRQLAGEISFSIPRGVEAGQLPVGIGAPRIDGDGKVRVQTDDPVSTLYSLTRWALGHDHELPDLELRRPTLEDVYLQLTTGRCARSRIPARHSRRRLGGPCGPPRVGRGAAGLVIALKRFRWTPPAGSA
jgi:ABC-2 type transport system ATP-binding protein